jgi:hypothetical protein
MLAFAQRAVALATASSRFSARLSHQAETPPTRQCEVKELVKELAVQTLFS